MLKTIWQRFMAMLPTQTRVVLWMVALPLALAAFGYWELRSYGPPEPFVPSASEQAEIQELEQLLARIQNDRYAKLTIDGKHYGNPLASQMVRDAIAERKGEGPSNQPSPWAAAARNVSLVIIGAGLIAALLGVLGLWRVKVAGARALRSREELLDGFAWWRAHLPRYLGALLFTLAVGFAALTLVRCITTYDAMFLLHATRNEAKWQIALLIFALVLTWGALAALWRLRSALAALDTQPLDVLGRTLTPQEAPGLWRYLGDLAAQVGAPVPQHIVLGMEDSFYATASDVVVQPAQQRLQGRTLHLPLTYLALLRREEIDAIVAHELGHFMGEDTAYSMHFAPLYAGLHDALVRVAGDDDLKWGNAPAVTFGSYVLDRFDLAVKHWSRVRELAADQVSARVAGPGASARALVRVTALSAVVHERVNEIARRPDEAGHDLVGLLTDALRTRGLEAPDLGAEAATAHPYDTHPPTLDRLQALGQPLDASLTAAALAPLDDSGLVWVNSLFADSGAVQAGLLEDFKATSRERNEETRKVLSAVASRASEIVAVNDRAAMFGLFAFLGLLFVGLTVLAAVVATRPGAKPPSIYFLVGMLVAAALFLGLTWWTWKRRASVTFELTPGGLRLPGMQHDLAWSFVDDYQVTTGNFASDLVFTLTSDAPVLKLAHSNYRRQFYSARKRRLRISMFGVRGMKLDAFCELLNDYIRAWHARQALESM